MTNANPQPTPTEWARLAHSLMEMRDTLVSVALALRDHQLTLDSPERHAARLQVHQLIERAKAGESKTGSGR
jgi:hypothetical protein